MLISVIQLCLVSSSHGEKITGLTDFLAGTTDLSHGLCDTNVENLFVIQAGPVSPNPTALLQSENFPYHD